MANIFSKSFWQPAAGKTRIRDVIRELPGAFGQTIVPGTIKFGQAIGGAIAAPSVAKQLAEAEAKQLETNQVIFQKMRQNKAEGKSNGNLISFLKNQNKMASPTLEEVVPAAKMTTKEIAGAGLGLGVEALGFGTAFKSAKSMRAAALAASKGVGPASTAGIVKATGKELARNVPFGYGADVSRRLMEGETGAAALKPGLGTAFTAALPVFGGAERAFRLSRANDIAKLQRFGFTSDEARKVAPNLGLPDTPALNKIGAKMGKLADQINSSTDINFVQKGEAQLQNLKNQFRQTLSRELQAGKVQIGRGAEEAGDLMAEARKYKSPKEFVEAQPTYYHGTAEDFTQIKSKRQLRLEGSDVEASNIGGDSPFVHLSSNKNIAEGYAKSRMRNIRGASKVLKYKVGGNLLDITKHPSEYTPAEKQILTDIGNELLQSSGGRGFDAQIGESLVLAGKPRKSYAGISKPSIGFTDIEQSQGLLQALENKGYSGIKFTDKMIGGGLTDTVAVIPAKLKTESELGSIWNQAQKGIAPAIKETAGNIRLDKFATSDEGKNLLRKIIDENKGFLAQRRGVRTWQETQAIADQIIPKTRLKKGTALNAEELQSLGDTVTSLTNKADNLSQKILAGDNSDKTLLEFARAKTELTFATASYAGATSEAGRSLNIIKKLNEALMSNDAKLIKQALKLTGDRDRIEDILSKLALMGDDDLAKIKFLRASSQATKLEMIQEGWINSILSAPPTQMANALGNTTMALLRPVTRGVQAGISKNVYLREAPEIVVGAAGALQDGIRNALFVFRNGLSPEQVSKVELGRLPAIPGKLGKGIRTPTRLLSSVDEFIKTVVGAGEIRALAYRQARKEGLKGQDAMERMYEIIQTPSKELLEAVTRAQQDATFQTPLGKFGNAIMELRNTTPGGTFVIPFIQTPVNIAKEMVRLSPAGFGVAAYKKAAGKYAGDMSAKASEDVAKAIIGSMIAIPVVLKAVEGKITGSAPKNKAEREAFYREGKRPYSIKIGNRYRSYRRMEPFASIFGILADMTQVKTEEGIQQAALQALGIIGRNFNDKTFMAGLSQAVEVLTDPEQSEQFFLNMASGLMPYSALSRTITQTIDPTVRRTESLKEKYMAQIPLLSKKLTPKRDLFGEEIKKTRSEILSPMGVSEESNDAVIKEMEALGVTPGLPGEKIFDLKLSQKEYDNYLKVSGRVTKKVLDTIVASPNWNNLSAREREKAVQDTIRKVREQTRDALFPLENKSGDISQYLRKQGYTKEESEQLAKKIITNIKERQTQQ